MANSIRALLIKRDTAKKGLIIEDTIFIDTLDNLYKLLECSTIDIQVRYIDGKPYDLIFDDEYMINGKSQEPKNCVALGTRKDEILEAIFGNLLICGIANDKGEETSLNDYDIKAIYKSQKIAQTNDKNELAIINYHFEETEI